MPWDLDKLTVDELNQACATVADTEKKLREQQQQQTS